MNFINLFKNQLFSTTTLTDEINDRDLVPDQVKQRVPFEEKGINTTSAFVVKKAHTVDLIPFTERGAPGQPQKKDKRDALLLESRAIVRTVTITADEIQNVALFGSMGERLESLQETLREAYADVLDSMAATDEYHRLGVLQGKLRDADGTTVVQDFYELFDVEPWPVVAFDLGAASPAPGSLRTTCSAVIRTMREGAQCMIDGVGAWAGKGFMDKLYAHPEVQQGYQWFAQNARLRDRAAFVSLEYGGIQFEEYSGHVRGVEFIGDDDVYFYPIVTSGGNALNGAMPANRLFQTRWAPAPFFSAVNQLGIPYYVRQEFDPSSDPAWVRYEFSSYPIHYCRKPQALVRGRAGA